LVVNKTQFVYGLWGVGEGNLKVIIGSTTSLSFHIPLLEWFQFQFDSLTGVLIRLLPSYIPNYTSSSRIIPQILCTVIGKNTEIKGNSAVAGQGFCTWSTATMEIIIPSLFFKVVYSILLLYTHTQHTLSIRTHVHCPTMFSQAIIVERKMELAMSCLT